MESRENKKIVQEKYWRKFMEKLDLESVALYCKDNKDIIINKYNSGDNFIIVSFFVRDYELCRLKIYDTRLFENIFSYPLHTRFVSHCLYTYSEVYKFCTMFNLIDL